MVRKVPTDVMGDDEEARHEEAGYQEAVDEEGHPEAGEAQGHEDAVDAQAREAADYEEAPVVRAAGSAAALSAS
jgi:hypothetical protein